MGHLIRLESGENVVLFNEKDVIELVSDKLGYEVGEVLNDLWDEMESENSELIEENYALYGTLKENGIVAETTDFQILDKICRISENVWESKNIEEIKKGLKLNGYKGALVSNHNTIRVIPSGWEKKVSDDFIIIDCYEVWLNDVERTRVMILVKDEMGQQNFINILLEANQGVVSVKLLEKYHEGLIFIAEMTVFSFLSREAQRLFDIADYIESNFWKYTFNEYRVQKAFNNALKRVILSDKYKSKILIWNNGENNLCSGNIWIGDTTFENLVINNPSNFLEKVSHKNEKNIYC